jgi:hypothetical protein
MVLYCNKALSMILLLYNLFYMFYTYALHPNFVVTKYGRDSLSQSAWTLLHLQKTMIVTNSLLRAQDILNCVDSVRQSSRLLLVST